jgi:hypothetical protein
MRDIVNDLNERLAAIASKYAEEMARYDEECRDAHTKHRAVIESLEHDKHALEEVLGAEARRSAGTEVVVRKPMLKLPPSDFNLDSVQRDGPPRFPRRDLAS